MFDFPIICTKCGWALVGWMAREGGGAGNKLHGEGVSSAPRREIEKHYCCQGIVEHNCGNTELGDDRNTVAAIIEMGATLCMRNNFVLRVFHNTTLHAIQLANVL